MKIYTSYWAQVRNFPENLIGLNTTIWPPKWRPLGMDDNGVIVINCPPLQPGFECEGLCNGKCDPKHPKDCEYLKTYRAQLDKINFDNFTWHLNHLRKVFLDEHPEYDTVDFALIVYEKYDKLCSERWPLRNWLEAHGQDVKEWHKNGK